MTHARSSVTRPAVLNASRWDRGQPSWPGPPDPAASLPDLAGPARFDRTTRPGPVGRRANSGW